MLIRKFIGDHWPLIGALAAGLVAWGVTTADISQLKTDRDKALVDHDTIIRIESKQDRMQDDITEIKQAIKQLADESRARAR